MITHLEPDILECEVKWTLENITTKKASGGDGEDSDAGRDWGKEEKGTTEDDMAGWHYRLDGHEFE